MFFPAFTLEHVAVADGRIRLRRGGSGPPLLLLHGNPQTHAMWHAVAPELAEALHGDLPGPARLRRLFKPPATADHAPYAKKAMARDMVEVMRHFGHRRFLVGSHDRGARVAHRLAIDYPRSGREARRARHRARPSSISSAPTWPSRSATTIGSGSPSRIRFPEMLINAAPEAWFTAHTSREPKPSDFFHPEALADYLAAAHPAMIRGMCEDYRAAATIDLEHDRASRAAGARCNARCWCCGAPRARSASGTTPLAIWRRYCSAEVTGGAVDSGHYLAEEAPAAVVERFLEFFG